MQLFQGIKMSGEIAGAVPFFPDADELLKQQGVEIYHDGKMVTVKYITGGGDRRIQAVPFTPDKGIPLEHLSGVPLLLKIDITGRFALSGQSVDLAIGRQLMVARVEIAGGLSVAWQGDLACSGAVATPVSCFFVDVVEPIFSFAAGLNFHAKGLYRSGTLAMSALKPEHFTYAFPVLKAGEAVSFQANPHDLYVIVN